MKIAIVADVTFAIPPYKYGGTQRVIAYLVDALQKLGHDVTLFAPGDSIVSCELVASCPKHTDPSESTPEEIIAARRKNIAHVLSRQNTFDIIHWHGLFTDGMQQITTPLLVTFHGPIEESRHPQDVAFARKLTHAYFNGVSKKYLEIFSALPWIDYVYNGLPVDTFPPNITTKGYLSFVGRFSEDKQPHLAIQTAFSLQKPLVLAARKDAAGEKYFDTYCKDLLTQPLVDFRGEVSEEEKKEIFRYAEVNLHPVGFDEPFGLTVVEAGLLGTPTIAFDRGSMRELIVDGVSGFVVQNLEQMIRVYPRAQKLDRKTVHNHFLQFSHMRMGRNYVKLYEEVIDKTNKRNSIL